MLIIKIETDNAAFEGSNAGFEVARILQVVANRLIIGPIEDMRLYDINGNACGSVSVED